MTAPARRFVFVPDKPPDRGVRFEPRADNREAAVLGVIEVGQLGPCPVGGAFYWRFWLPGGPQFGRASSAKAARDHLASRAEQWIEAAGLNWGRQ